MTNTVRKNVHASIGHEILQEYKLPLRSIENEMRQNEVVVQPTSCITQEK